MSATVYTFPPERAARPAPAPLDAVIISQNGESLVFDTSEDFWANVRDSDPELKRRLDGARAALDRANALERRAQALIEQHDAIRRAEARTRDRRRSFMAVALLVSAIAILGWLA